MSSSQELAALAWSYFQAGAHESAEELYRQSVTADPNFADAWVFLAIVQKSRGNLDGAAESYRQALSVRPDYFEALNNLGTVPASVTWDSSTRRFAATVKRFSSSPP